MNYYIKLPCLSLEKTLESGQCFRWRREETAGGEVIYRGIVGTRAARLRQEADGITLLDIKEADAPFWRDYFDAETDYEAILNRFSEDEILRRAVSENRGLRILRQEPFETLITFILSQNNNIPRIRGIVERLCMAIGLPIAALSEPIAAHNEPIAAHNEPIAVIGGSNAAEYGFPSAERLAKAEPSELEPIRAGFRTRYIMDAAQKVADGTVDLSEVGRADYETGKAMLRRIVGVGEKVADCVLLFAYHKTEAFPSDVWIKRIMAEYYKNGLPECAVGEKGIAQQYLFEYFRKKPV